MIQSDRRRLALDGLALAAVTAALSYVLGGFGLLVGVAVAVALVFGSPVYAVAVGQLLFVLVATTVFGEVPAEGIVVAQVGLAALFVAALVDAWPARTAAGAVAIFGVAAVGLGTVYALDPLWQGVAVLTGLYAILAYTLHRYELVSLNLVGEAEG